MDDNRESEAKASSITKWGLGLSALYLAGIAIYVLVEWQHLLMMKPNEFGDFLAGAFGPMALGWLVCGYFQQGIELRQNTQALSLQVEELRNSVEQQAVLARSNQELLEHERHIADEARAARSAEEQPKFHLGAITRILGGTDRICYFEVLNSGARVWLVEKMQESGSGDFISISRMIDAESTIRINFSRRPQFGFEDHVMRTYFAVRTMSGAVLRVDVSVRVSADRQIGDPVIDVAALTDC
ncbi:hypothetical protein CQ393_13455 [Stenotrophomonas sp. MYb238]|uniref:hypothetical protein n=1 Tax=Stenotrophomonas sp. MYb238 TaxID=2040281 RepID=UPI001292B97E|nr:hypothetical protein [Stenotrophomonas sp. MYb238]MQP76894.1 hypothetical protein [Stenotrophomonas sp. MYb238]